MRKSPSPPAGLGTAFSVAEARRRGVKRADRDRPWLQRPFHGARLLPSAADHPQGARPASPWEEEQREVSDRMAALWAVLPERAFFYGPSAAFLWHLPLPGGALESLHVAMPYPATAIRRPGVISKRLSPRFADVVTGRNFRALSPATTWASLGPFLDEPDLVAVTDALISGPLEVGGRTRGRRPLATLDELRAVVDRGRWSGAPVLRRSLARARSRCLSRRESHLRLLLEDAGLPEPVLNTDVFVDGIWLCCPDLQYPDFKVGVEYQSTYHLGPRQYDADIDRRRRMAAAGWLSIELTATHVSRAPREAARRVGEGLRSRGWAG